MLSFDATVHLSGGLVVDDEDLVALSGSISSLLFDGSTEGLDAALGVDAAQAPGEGVYRMSPNMS